MTTLRKLVLGGLLGSLLIQHNLCASPVARVLEVSGKAAIVSADGKSRPAETYGSVYADEKIQLDPKSKVVVGFHADGRLEKVVSAKAVRVVTVTKTALDPRDGVSLILVKKRQSRLVATGIQELPNIPVGGVTILRGPTPKKPLPLIIPISDSAVLSDSPEFSWPSQQEAVTYEISVYSRKDRLWKFQTKTLQATYTATQPLKPGRIYQWKVVAETPTGSQLVCEAEFTVAFAEDAEGLAELAASKEPSLVALAAAGYEQLDLMAEAITTYERLVVLTPKAAAMHAALSDLYDRAGREKEARKSRKAASNLGFQFKKRKIKSDGDKKKLTNQRMRKQFQRVKVAFQEEQEVESQVIIKLLAWAASLPAAESLTQWESQMLASRFLWDPLAVAAKNRVTTTSSDSDRAEEELRGSTTRMIEQLLDEGVPEHWALLGRLNLAALQYGWQRYESTEQTLDSLSKHIGHQEIWPGDQARYWNLRGLLASEHSQFALAFEHHTIALRLRRSAALTVDEAESLNNLGKLLLELGDSEAARTVLEQAQAIYKQCEGHAFYPQIANAAAFTNVNLSKALEATRNFEASVELLRDVADKRTQPTSSRKEFVDCVCHNNLGLLLYQTGQFQESREQLESSRRLSAELFGAAHIRTLENEVNLGWLDLAVDKLSTAEQRFRGALTALSKSEPKHPRIAEIQAYLARVASKLGNPWEATQLLHSALEQRQQYLTETLQSALSERDRLAFVQKLRVHTESIGWPGVLDTYLELAPELEIRAQQQYRHVLNWKGILHDPSLGLHASSDPRCQSLRAEWTRIRQQLRQGLGGNEVRNTNLERNAEEIERRLRRLQQLPTGILSVNLEDVVAALPEHSVLFDVIEVRRYLPRKQGQTVQDNRVYIGFLIDQAGHVSRLDLGDAAEVDTAIESFIHRVASRSSYRRQARRLDRLLARPLRENLAESQLLIISADGWLHRVPWGALPGDKKNFWLEELTFATIPSAQSLVRRQSSKSSSAASWLVVGDVDYDSSAGDFVERGSVEQPDDQPSRWDLLASSGSEARHIDQLLRRRFSTAKLGTLLTGAEATKEEIVSQLASRKYVHFATHGSFVDRQTDAFDIQGLSAQLDSFLVFAGANQDQTSQAYLTAEEIGNLDMRGTEVVTLSACETGLGHIQAGQGLIGLVGALDRAGVGAVVSALWKVDDAATAKLMETFYSHLLEHDGLAPVTALRKSQLDLLTQVDGQYEHPFYWAPWVLSANRLH